MKTTGIEREDSAFQVVFQDDTWDNCPEYMMEQTRFLFVLIDSKREQREKKKLRELLTHPAFCLVQDICQI